MAITKSSYVLQVISENMEEIMRLVGEIRSVQHKDETDKELYVDIYMTAIKDVRDYIYGMCKFCEEYNL